MGRVSFSSLLRDDRDGLLAFRAYLNDRGDRLGSQQMRMWLILSGLERKYAAKHSDLNPEDFVTWLVKVTEERFTNSFIYFPKYQDFYLGRRLVTGRGNKSRR